MLYEVITPSSDGLDDTLIKAARLERRDGWQSDALMDCLCDDFALPPGGDVWLTDAAAGQLNDRLTDRFSRWTRQQAEALKRGQQQARTCLGRYGLAMPAEQDATLPA